MRSTRATFFVVVTALVAAIFGSGCAADDAVIGTDLDLSSVVDGTTATGQSDAARDDLSLRSPGQGTDEQAAPGEVTGRPSPPTLSANPAVTAPSTTSTVAPTTTSVPTTPLTAAITEPSTTVTTAAPTSSETPLSAPESTGSSTTVAPADPSTSAPTTGGPALEPGEGQSYTLLNDLRSGLGLGPLARNAEMDAFARDWSKQMAESGRFEHSTGPYGENIAFTSNTGLSAAEAAELFHQLWVDSPGHYANMTNDNYASTGVGLFLTDRGWYGTHVFNF